MSRQPDLCAAYVLDGTPHSPVVVKADISNNIGPLDHINQATIAIEEFLRACCPFPGVVAIVAFYLNCAYVGIVSELEAKEIFRIGDHYPGNARTMVYYLESLCQFRVGFGNNNFSLRGRLEVEDTRVHPYRLATIQAQALLAQALLSYGEDGIREFFPTGLGLGSRGCSFEELMACLEVRNISVNLPKIRLQKERYFE